jgi:eukaryotic-like serine/threonine-protein kinase
MADRVGQRLGHYRLIRLIGRGGFADVYLGEHIYLKTEAAIKILHTRLTEKEVEKFLAEARTVACLRHAHIVSVLDFGVQDETPFLVMDYARNGSLHQNHPEGTTLPLATIVLYIMQVAQTLQYAHDEKLIHRDIKPENIFLGDHHEVLPFVPCKILSILLRC